MRKYIFASAVLLIALTAALGDADVLFISGPTIPAAENVLFNQPGLIQTGNPVQGQTELTKHIINFTFFQGNTNLTTTSPGEPRIDMPGFTFNSLRFQFDNPLISFTQLDFGVNANQVGPITFNAVATDGHVFSHALALDA